MLMEWPVVGALVYMGNITKEGFDEKGDFMGTLRILEASCG